MISEPLKHDGKFNFSIYETREGIGSVVASCSGLLEVALPVRIQREELIISILDRYPEAQEGSRLTNEAAELLLRYFSGKPVRFDLPIDDRGYTRFQRLVYAEVRKIVYGSVKSYGEVAREIGQPGSARGVGLAMARNPLPIIIPCHRVIGSAGKMTGYSAPGGIKRKALLLLMERNALAGYDN